jgi:uncharacterized protein YecT (DUF1311 family)
MLQLTAPQATLIVAVVGLVAGFVGWLGQGSTFLLHRWWTGAPRQEQAAYLNSVADLAGKLRAHGMTMDDVRQFEAIMRNPAVAGTAGASDVVDALAEEAEEPDVFHSNVAMKARTGAAYDVADAHLKRALMDLRLLLGEREEEALETAQARWCEYRLALEVCAGLEFEGGTNAPLAEMMAGLTETERRTAEIHAKVEERSAR